MQKLKKEQHSVALVLAGGAFGTSIANVLAQNFTKVIVLVRSPDIYEGFKNGENTIYLPGHMLSKNIEPAMNWQEIWSRASGLKIELVVSGLPSSAIRSFCHTNFSALEKLLSEKIPFVSLSKGLDCETLEFPDDLYFDIFPNYRGNFVFLSGPSFAKEIMDKQITLVSLAGKERDVLLSVTEQMMTDCFKVFPTYDIKGLLIGGALKNILAMACGIIEGLGHNHNTRAALITKGIEEMLRFGRVFNARPETFYGLSGMGDLILTTTGDLSRNKSFGIEIAKGRSPEEIITEKRSVIEGPKTCKAVYLLSKKYAILAPIFKGMYKILYESVPPDAVLKHLMTMANYEASVL